MRQRQPRARVCVGVETSVVPQAPPLSTSLRSMPGPTVPLRSKPWVQPNTENSGQNDVPGPTTVLWNLRFQQWVQMGWNYRFACSGGLRSAATCAAVRQRQPRARVCVRV